MKNLKRIIAVFMAVLMVLSLGACSDLPTTSQAEWSYKYGGKEYPIGVYIYSLFTAYNQAYNILSENLGDDFDKEASILETESSFDETGDVLVCSDWILEEADRITKNIIAIDMLVDKYDVTLDPEQEYAAKEQARKDWYLGPYYEESLSYGSQITSYEDLLKPYGISFESFYQATYLASVKQSAVFDKFYNKGGVEEIPAADVTEYFQKNYVSYGYFTVNFYETSTDSATGQSVTTPLTEEKIADIKDNLELYVKMMANGTELASIGGIYAAYAGLDYSPVIENTEPLAVSGSSSLPDEAVEALINMADGEAKVLYLGSDNTQMAYFLCRQPVKYKTKEYVTNNYSALLQNMKGDDFLDMIQKYTNEIDCEINVSAVEKYTPALVEKLILEAN